MHENISGLKLSAGLPRLCHTLVEMIVVRAHVELKRYVHAFDAQVDSSGCRANGVNAEYAAFELLNSSFVDSATCCVLLSFAGTAVQSIRVDRHT